jgi:hypothetical protein
MKKLILTTSAFLICGTLVFSQSIENNKYPRAEKKQDVVKNNDSKKPATTNVKPKATVLWSNEFDDADDWVNVNSSTIYDGWVFTTAPYSQSIEGGTGFSILESTTNSNGYAMIDSDGAYSPDGAGQLVGTLTTATPINLQGEPDVLLIFEHNYRWWQDSRGVRVSGDNGNTWEEFPITDNAGFPNNQSSENPEVEIIDISSVAGDQEEVLIEFYYDDNNFWSWYWAIDDAQIIRKPGNDVATNVLAYGSNGLFYHQIPLAQIAPIDASVTVENRGINTQYGVTLQVDETVGGTFSQTSQAVTLLPDETDSLVMSAPFTPSGPGNYNFEFTLLNDSIDDLPNNNVMDDYSFEVGQYIYARDNGNATGSYAPEVPYQLGNFYDIYAAAELTGVDVQFGGIMAEGAEVTGELYLLTPDGDFQFEAETEVYTATADDAGELVTLKFPSAITLNANQSYLLTAGSTFDEFSIALAGTSPDQTSFVFGDVGPNGETWYFTTSTPMVRMNFDPSLNIQNNEAQNLKVNLYPNPAKEMATLEFSLESNADYKLEVLDITGKSVFNSNATANTGVNQINIPTENLNEGIYIYKLTVNGNAISNKFVVSK